MPNTFMAHLPCSFIEKQGNLGTEKSLFLLLIHGLCAFFRPLLTLVSTAPFFASGARLRGRTATQRSKKGSEKVLGWVLGKGSQKDSEKGVCCGFFTVKRGSEKGSRKSF